MNNENGSMDIDSLRRMAAAQRDQHLLIDTTEELNFRLSAFCRAYLATPPDGAAILKRGRVLCDVVTDFGDLLKSLISTFEEKKL